jgi:cob(I)alamin adenosyltransferase
MKIYTKTGDSGMSSLWGGARISKSSLRIEAYGTVDELNSILGMVMAFQPHEELEKKIDHIQAELMTIGSDLATPINVDSKIKVVRLSEGSILDLEKHIDQMTQELPELKSFILPSGNKAGSTLHHARAVCRRAERACVRLAEQVNINEQVIMYLNRLSDWLFTAARYENNKAGVNEKKWQTN